MPLLSNSPSVPGANAAKEPLRILIVDDQAVVRGAVRSALEKLDTPFLVIEAASGEEALGIMRVARVDIVFCDVQLPGLSGPEALAHAYGGQMPRPFMVLMSSSRSPAVAEVGRSVGVYEFMQKPFRTFDVLNAVSAYERLRQLTRVLIVDDSSTARKLMRRILDRSHFAIDLAEAESGAMALALARKTEFDVIFLDFNMPGLNGVETAGQMLQAHPKAQIVLISTEQQASMVRSAQFVGAFAFLKKPFEVSDVDAVLHDAFSLKRPSIAKPTHAIFSSETSLMTKAS